MMLDAADLDAAVVEGLLDAETKAKLVAWATARRGAKPIATPRPRFDPTQALYYGGALIVISAMGLFVTAAFSALGGWALTTIAVVYAAGFLWLGNRLWAKVDTRIPGGLCIAIAVSLTPLAIYGVQDGLDLWSAGNPGGYDKFYPLVNGSWIYMEIGAVAASAFAFWKYRFPFILLIASVAIWFFSMDLAALIVHRHMPDWSSDWELRQTVSKIVGAALIAAAWTLDLKSDDSEGLGFWPHLFGALTLWGAVTSGSGDEFAAALYCAFNLLFIAFGLFLNRRVYAVFGAIGLAIYLGHLAYVVFKDVLIFSFALSGIGLAIIFAGIWLQRRRHAIAVHVDTNLPDFLRALRPARACLVNVD
jgi:hypothetical protein